MTKTFLDVDWLAQSAARMPDAVALVDDDGTALSYAALDALAAQAAMRLRASGTAEGDIRLIEVGRVDRALIAELWGSWRVGVAPLVIEGDSPILTRSPKRVADWLKLRVPSVHTIVLTSGSSGNPRPVRLTRENVAAAIAASSQRLGNEAGDRWLLVLPIFHIGGLSVLWRAAAVGGAVILHSRFDEERVAGAMRSDAVSIVSLVPTMLYRLLDFDPGPYPVMKAVLLGGAAAQRELVERGLDAGLPILQTYGMTETCSQVATVVPGEAVGSLGSVGRPLPGVSISTGEAGAGEIVVSGPIVSPGYLGEPDRQGDHHTGDIGYLDEHGRLVVLCRIDDMAVTGGENVYPQHVADVLGRSRFVSTVEVVAVPDPEWGQSLVAIVVGEEAALPRLQGWAANWLPRYEIPKGWIFVDEMPTLPSGKVDRTALAEMARRAN
jgi:O-succinylbenzoic acid--CoA ligase